VTDILNVSGFDYLNLSSESFQTVERRISDIEIFQQYCHNYLIVMPSISFLMIFVLGVIIEGLTLWKPYLRMRLWSGWIFFVMLLSFMNIVFVGVTLS
jgi:hypothetical protein